jgi:hypothetical protein
MSIKPKTKPLVSKRNRVLRPKARKEHLQPVVEVVLEVEGRGKFGNNMLKGSIALGVGRDRQPLDRGHVGVANGIHVAIKGPEVEANPPDPNIHHIDPMMLPRGLPITVPNGLRKIIIPTNLLKFIGSPNEDPTTHVEIFVKVLITSLVIDHDYYLIWFPSTLADSAYAWYRSHVERSFNTWEQFQVAFLRHYRLVIGQQQALAILTNIKQGPSEDITSSVCQFRVVYTCYVGNLLNDDTICHYFIQGFNMPSTIRDILNMRPRNLEATIVAALEVEVIDKENDKMLQKAKEPIHAFIPLYHDPNEFPRYPTMDYHHATIPQVPLMQPIPLAMLPPLEPILMAAPFMNRQWEEFKVEVKRLNDNFKDEMVKTMQGISEQMSCLVKNQNQNVISMHHESGAHTSCLWCTHCKQPNHNAQFCPILLQQQPSQSMSTNTRPYRPPHQVGQAASNPPT